MTDKYGRTKLDHGLSYFCLAFEKILELMLILLVPLLVVQQIVLYGDHHPEIVIPALVVLMIVLICVGVHEIQKLKEGK